MTGYSALTRRMALVSLAGAALLPMRAWAALPAITVHKDPNCGCCEGWVEHLRARGYPVTAVDTAHLNRVKARLGIPSDLASCHTAELGRYVIEGHVPAAAIEKFWNEQPKARGLAVPGMPSGSPGMDGDPEEYEVILFDGAARRPYGRFKGEKEI